MSFGQEFSRYLLMPAWAYLGPSTGGGFATDFVDRLKRVGLPSKDRGSVGGIPNITTLFAKPADSPPPKRIDGLDLELTKPFGVLPSNPRTLDELPQRGEIIGRSRLLSQPIPARPPRYSPRGIDTEDKN